MTSRKNTNRSLLDFLGDSGATESDRPKQSLDHIPFAIAVAKGDDCQRLDAISAGGDHIGMVRRSPAANADGLTVDAWSNMIRDESGAPMFRRVALAAANPARRTQADDIRKRFLEKDVLLRELQHRVKNTLSAVMKAHAVEGIRLDLKVDTWPVSINVAMPTGLVVNEVRTHALKHAFVGRPGGTITPYSLVDAEGCQGTIADDGVGLPPRSVWPTSGRFGSLIVQSLRQNDGATLAVASSPEQGLRVTMGFARADAAPDAA